MEKNEKIGKKKVIVLMECGYSLFFLFCVLFFGFLSGFVLNLPPGFNFFYSIILLISWVFLVSIFIILVKLFKRKVVIVNVGICNWIAITLESRDMLDNLIDIKINNLSKEE